jgi:uncharacterized coiled-coil protein SlyX
MVVFGKQPEDKVQKVMVELIKKVNDNIKRLRILEQRIAMLETRENSVEINTSNQYKTLQKSISDLESKMNAQEEMIEKLDTTLKEIIKQIKTLASKSDVLEIKELVDIFNPLKSNFVTKEDVERMIEEKMK